VECRKTGYEPAFKNAKFWNESHWEWATKRTLGHLLSENILPMQESGQLNFIKDLQRIFRKIRVGFDIFFAMGILISR
jgi:hypothetical protein